VVDALAKVLAPLIALSIDESIKTKLKVFESAMRDMKLDNTRLNNKCDSIAKENDILISLVNAQTAELMIWKRTRGATI